MCTIAELKEQAGEVPDFLCRDIDKIIAIVQDAERDINYIFKNERNYESVEEVIADLPTNVLDGSIEIRLEEMRTEIEKLRELGKFWYKQAKEKEE